MSGDDALGLAEHARQGNMSMDELVRGVQSGALDPSGRYTTAQLNDVLERLIDITPGLPTSFEGDTLGDAAHVVELYVPGRNIHYLTLMLNGKVAMNLDEVIGSSDPFEGMQEVINTLADAMVFDSHKALHPHKPPVLNAPRAAPAAPRSSREHPAFIVDPLLREYVRINSVVFLENIIDEDSGRAQRITSADTLEQIMDDPGFLSRAQASNIEVRATPLVGFFRRFRPQIERRVQMYHSEVSELPQVRRLVARLVDEFNVPVQERAAFFALYGGNVESVFELYQSIERLKPEVGGADIPTEDYIIGLREHMMLTLMEARKSSGANVLDAAIERCRIATTQWIAYTRAADYVERDPLTARSVEELRSGIAPENYRNAIFNTTVKVMERIVAPGSLYSPRFLNLTLRGLWMQDLLVKRSGGEMVRRTSQGSMVEFSDGFGHYIARRQEYEPLLDSAFDALASRGEVPDADVYTTMGCELLGRELYRSLAPADQLRFRRLDNSEVPLAPNGTTLGRILRVHVALHRGAYQSRLAQE